MRDKVHRYVDDYCLSGGDATTADVIDAAVEEALRCAADYFMQRDGSTYVVEELLGMREGFVKARR